MTTSSVLETNATLVGTWQSSLYSSTFAPNGYLGDVSGTLTFTLNDRSVTVFKKGGKSWNAQGQVTFAYDNEYRNGHVVTFPVSVYAEIQPIGSHATKGEEPFLCVRATRPKLDTMEELKQHFALSFQVRPVPIDRYSKVIFRPGSVAVGHYVTLDPVDAGSLTMKAT